MIDEIFNVMECFEDCFVNGFGELIISDRGNMYFTAKGCKDKTDIICKMLEWCSRPIAKVNRMRQQKETKSGEKNFWKDTTSILERNSHRLICTGYMINWEMLQIMSLH